MNIGLSSTQESTSESSSSSSNQVALRRRVLIASIGALVIIGVLFAIVIRSYLTEEGSRQPVIIRSNVKPDSPDYLEVKASIMDVGIETDELTLRLEFEPHGTLNQGDGVLARRVHLDVSSDTDEGIVFEAGAPMEPREVKVELSDGEVSDYPFDHYMGHFEMLVTETEAESGGFIPAPSQLKFYGYQHGFHFDVAPAQASTHDIAGVGFTLTRSPLVLASVIFGMVLMWIIALMNIPFVGMVALRIWDDRELELFVYMTGLIVGFYFFRDALPGSPPIGTFSDYLAFFWAEAISGCAAIVLALVWVSRMYKDVAKGKGG
jgi:Domain of unknown function (DUF4436)